MKKYIRTIAALLAVAAAAVSCEMQEEFISPYSGDAIGVSLSSADIQTKAQAQASSVKGFRTKLTDGIYLEEIITDSDATSYDAVITKGSVVTTENTTEFWMNGYYGTTTYFEAAKATNSTTSGWYLTDASDNGIPWIDNTEFTFWSYAPQTLATGTYGFTSGTTMSISNYKTPSSIADQKDIVIGYNKQSSATSKVVDVTLYHALAAVRFDVTDVISSVEVTNVKISGIKSQGSCAIAEAADTLAFTWTPGGPDAEFSQAFKDDDFVAEGERALVQSMDSTKIFFMVPQTLGSTAKISVTLKYPDGTSKTLDASLETITWKAGKRYTYKLSLDGLDVSIDDEVKDGVKSDIVIENLGNVNAFVRVAVAANWCDDSGRIVAPWTNDISALGAGWSKGTDGFYYYANPVIPSLQPGQESSADDADELFESYTQGTAPVTGAHLVMSLAVQAIPSDGTTTYDAAWAAAQALNK